MVIHTNGTIDPTNSVPDVYLLLHGAWHDGGAWADVKAALETRGHEVHTPTLAGHGPDATNRHVSRQECAAPIIDYLEQHDLHHVVLVAHSFAGVIAPLIVEAMPERIRHLMFLDALIPVQGENAFYGTPEDTPVPLEMQEDGTASLPLPVWQERFWADPQADPALAASERGEAVWRSRLYPESLTAALEPATLSRFELIREAGLPTTYIRLLGDHVFGSPDFWQTMVDRLPGCQARLIQGCHEVMFTRPTALAAELIAAVQTFPLLDLTRQFYARLSAGDIEGAAVFISPQFIEHVGEAERGAPEIGVEAFRQARLRTREKLMDVAVTFREAQQIDAETLFTCAEIRATERTSRQPVLIHAFSLIRFKGRLMAEHWEYQVKAAPVPVAVPA